jgi:hypothetical protein
MLFSCGNSDYNATVAAQQDVIKKDTLPIVSVDSAVKKQVSNKQASSSLYTKIDQNTKIEVQTVKKSIDTASKFFSKYSNKCTDWNLNKDEILKILKSSTEIDGQEFHNYYDVLPCYFSGEVNISNQLASYEINAGAFVTIFFKDTSIYLGYKRNDYKKYFLLGPGID